MLDWLLGRTFEYVHWGHVTRQDHKKKQTGLERKNIIDNDRLCLLVISIRMLGWYCFDDGVLLRKYVVNKTVLLSKPRIC